MTTPAVTAARPRIVYLYLAVNVVSWAGNWPLMKLALADAPPLSFVLLRLVGTLALMAPLLLVLRAPLLPVAGERLGLFSSDSCRSPVSHLRHHRLDRPGRAGHRARLYDAVLGDPIELWLGMERFGRLQRRSRVPVILFMNPGLVDWGDPLILGGNAMLLLAAISGRQAPFSAATPLALDLLGADLLATPRQHRGRRNCIAGCRAKNPLVARPRASSPITASSRQRAAIFCGARCSR